MQQHNTQPADKTDLSPADFDTLLKAAVDAFFDVVDCELRIRAIKEEIALRQELDRNSLDLIA